MMLLVNLRSSFFAGGVLYRKNPEGTKIPGQFEDILPKSAEIMGRLPDEEEPEPRARRTTKAERAAKAKAEAKISDDDQVGPGNPKTLKEVGKELSTDVDEILKKKGGG